MLLPKPYQEFLLSLTGASAVTHEELIQSLWSGYGKILRISLQGGQWPTVIAKLVAPPAQKHHPRGWSTDIGHQRKLKSYQVETTWYKEHATASDNWRIARFLGATSGPEGQLMVLEDLDAAGFPLRKHSVNLDEIKACISWLAHFHAAHLGKSPTGLWEEGCYWHLATRPEEFKIMRGGPLKRKAKDLDRTLRNCRYRTFVHGDAKLANFCFAPNRSVAAVDFQYVGGGCGMKDVAYFLGSCLDEDGCITHETELLDFYFAVLRNAVSLNESKWSDLEAEWRILYPVAWADFTRFLEGWMPSHRKLHRYSREMVERALKGLY